MKTRNLVQSSCGPSYFRWYASFWCPPYSSQVTEALGMVLWSAWHYSVHRPYLKKVEVSQERGRGHRWSVENQCHPDIWWWLRCSSENVNDFHQNETDECIFGPSTIACFRTGLENWIPRIKLIEINENTKPLCLCKAEQVLYPG